MAENRKVQYTRMVLADSLIELMRDKPFEKITIRELCELANVNRSTFYLHYEDIYALLHYIEDDTLTWVESFIKELSGLFHEGEKSIVDALERLFECFLKNSKHLQVLMSEHGDQAFQKRVFRAAYQMCDFSSMQSQLKIEKALTEDLYFIFLVSGGVGIVQHWLKNDLKESPREIAEAVYNMTAAIR